MEQHGSQWGLFHPSHNTQYSTSLIHSWPAHAVCVSAMSVNQMRRADKAGENEVYVRPARKRCKSTGNPSRFWWHSYDTAPQHGSVHTEPVVRWPTHSMSANRNMTRCVSVSASVPRCIAIYNQAGCEVLFHKSFSWGDLEKDRKRKCIIRR